MSARDENKPHPPRLRGPMPSLTFTSQSRPRVITWSVSFVPTSTLTTLAYPCDVRMREPTSDMVSYALTGAAPGGGAQTVYPGQLLCVFRPQLSTQLKFSRNNTVAPCNWQAHASHPTFALALSATRYSSAQAIRGRDLALLCTLTRRPRLAWQRALTIHTSNSRRSDMD
jgi:hypothetical protein